MSTGLFAVNDGSATPRPYPSLDPDQIASINAKLVEVVSLGHAGQLTAAQLAELKAYMEVQARNAETLHRFVLTNADEPAFIRPPIETGRA